MKEACERAGRPRRWTSQGSQEPEFFYVYVPPSLVPVSRRMVTESPAVIARKEERNGKEKNGFQLSINLSKSLLC